MFDSLQDFLIFLGCIGLPLWVIYSIEQWDAERKRDQWAQEHQDMADRIRRQAEGGHFKIAITPYISPVRYYTNPRDYWAAWRRNDRWRRKIWDLINQTDPTDPSPRTFRLHIMHARLEHERGQLICMKDPEGRHLIMTAEPGTGEAEPAQPDSKDHTPAQHD